MPTITIEEIIANDRRLPPSERSLPWQESRNGVTVVVEPNPHWAMDMLDIVLKARNLISHEIDEGLWTGAWS